MCECNNEDKNSICNSEKQQLRRDIIDLTIEYTALLNSNYDLPLSGDYVNERMVVLDQIALLIQEMIVEAREFTDRQVNIEIGGGPWKFTKDVEKDIEDIIDTLNPN